jgi:SanA protein
MSFPPFVKRLAMGGALASAVVLGMMGDVQLRYLNRIHSFRDTTSVTQADAILVLGASILQAGKPSDALRDRLLVAKQLLEEGKAPYILVTGDDGKLRSDEVSVMKKFLIDQGISEGKIKTDGEGYRTYESCKRAAETFHLQRAILVTQRFHLGRALYLCNQLGVDSEGVTGDLMPYRRIFYFWTRDLAASVKAWSDIHLIPPKSPVTI